MAIIFETKRIALAAGAAPVDLAADSDFGLSELGELWTWLAVQNVTTRLARYRETTLAPAGTATDTGFTLSGGAGLIILVNYGVPFWFWSASGATIAISPGAASPSRPG